MEGISVRCSQNPYDWRSERGGQETGRGDAAPEIPNFAQRRKGIRLAAGMTLAIEPMITAGRYDVVWEDDGWTVVTEDGSLASHYENTILITDGEPEILSL